MTIKKVQDLNCVFNEREHQCRMILDGLPMLICSFLPGGEFTFVNKAYCEYFGKTPDELVGTNFQRLIPESDREHVMKQISALTVESPTQSHEHQVLAPGGGLRWQQWTNSALFDDQGKIIAYHSIGEDITDRKQREESEAKYELLMEYAGEAIFIAQEGVLTFANTKTQELTGYSPEDFLFKPFVNFIHSDDREFVLDRHTKRQQGVELPTNYPFKIITKSGAVKWVELNAATIEWKGKLATLNFLRDMTDRMQAQTELQESEEKYRLLFESMNEGFVLHEIITDEQGNPCDFRFLEMNPACERLIGLKREKMIGHSVREFTVEPHWIERYGRIALSGVPEHFQDYSTTLERWYEVFAYQPRRGQCAAIFSDITERKLSEEALRESQRKLSDLMSNLPGMAYKCLDKKDWPMEFVSEGSIALTGYSPSELEGISSPHYGDLIHPDDRDMVWDCVQRAIKNGRPFVIEYRIRDKKGDQRWVWEQGRAVGQDNNGGIILEGFISDISERKIAEEALRKSTDRERFLSDVIEKSEQPFAVGYADGSFGIFNQALCDLIGYDAEELKSINWSEILTPPEWRPIEKEALIQLERTGQPVRYEKEYIHKDGSRVPVELFVHAVKDQSGNVQYFYGFITGISERKKAEEYQRELHNQLAQAQKMESIGRLAGGVAHDFNNMLSVIIGYTELSMDSVRPSEPLYNNLREILNAAHRSRAITHQLLAFARKEAVIPEVMDINTAVKTMLKMIQRLIGENITLNWSPGKDLWPIKIDPSQIDQILANLCVNAKDAISDVGTIGIETENSTIDKDYCATHHYFKPGDYVTLSVSDDGCGMDKETSNKIFEPYFTTKERGKGTGLGLPTVYGIVKQNDGFLNVYSEPGKGTTFRVYLPKYARQEESKQRSVIEVEHKSRGETILVVEDEESILNMVERILKRLGYVVLTASKPGQAIVQAETHSGQISLLLTDVIMPDMNGRELSEKIRNLYPRIKCLFMSGYTADVISNSGVIEEGMNFIQKPFSTKNLAAQVNKALSKND